LLRLPWATRTKLKLFYKDLGKVCAIESFSETSAKTTKDVSGMTQRLCEEVNTVAGSQARVEWVLEIPKNRTFTFAILVPEDGDGPDG
jgi:hypothetical protein